MSRDNPIDSGIDELVIDVVSTTHYIEHHIARARFYIAERDLVLAVRELTCAQPIARQLDRAIADLLGAVERAADCEP